MYLPFFECARILYVVHADQLCHNAEKIFRTAITQFYQKIISSHLTFSTNTPEKHDTLHISWAVIYNNKYKQTEKAALVLYQNRNEKDKVLRRKNGQSELDIWSRQKN